MATLDIRKLKGLIQKGLVLERIQQEQKFLFLGYETSYIVSPKSTRRQEQMEQTHRAINDALNSLGWWDRLELAIQIILLWMDGSKAQLREVLGDFAELRIARSIMFTFSSSSDVTMFDAWYIPPDCIDDDWEFSPPVSTHWDTGDPLVWGLLRVREGGNKSTDRMENAVGRRILESIGNFAEFTHSEWPNSRGQRSTIYILKSRRL